MRDRYTAEEWESNLIRFNKQGGEVVWQRGTAFWARSYNDIKSYASILS